MSVNSMYGATPIPNRRWDPQIEVSQDNVGYVPSGDFRPDPGLPVIGVDPFDPSGGIVLEKGRFVGIGFVGGRGATASYRMGLTDGGKTSITLSDGLNVPPQGMMIGRAMKQIGEFTMDTFNPKFKRTFHAGIPFVLAINNSYGTLRSGDPLTGYFGSTTSTSIKSAIHVGKPVLWVPRRSFVTATPASASFLLPAATMPGVPVSVIAVFAAGALVTTTTNTLTHNGSAWVVSFTGAGSGTITEVHYAYGHDVNFVGGEVDRIRSVTDMQADDSFLKYVQIDYDFEGNNDLPPLRPAMQRYATTAVASQVPSTIVVGSVYRVANYPMSIFHPVVVRITNVDVTDANGIKATYANPAYYTLPTGPNLTTQGYFNGLYHSVNWRTGIIELSNNIVANGVPALQVDYSFISRPVDGPVLWAGGILGMTDGANIPASQTALDYTNTSVPITNANNTGVRASLNFADVVGEMKLFVR